MAKSISFGAHRAVLIDDEMMFLWVGVNRRLVVDLGCRPNNGCVQHSSV